MKLKKAPFQPKLRTIKALKGEAWKTIALYVRKRDKKCVSCATGLADNCGHYQVNTERNQELGGNALWYDVRNLNGQCVSCNKWRSGNLAPYAIYLEEKYGSGILQELRRLWQTPKKWTRQEIEEIIEKYVLR